MLYPDRVPNSTYIPSLDFADEDEFFYVHYLFILLNRLIYGRDKDTPAIRKLLYTAMRLYGWEKTPLYQAIRNDESTLEEIRDARCQRFDEHEEIEELKSARIFWSYHDALLYVPMSWYRPGVLEGDVICHHIFRYEDRGRDKTKPILPSLENSVYHNIRRNLEQVGTSALESCQELERIFVELYGGVQRSCITVRDLLAEEPTIQEKYLLSWDCF